MDLGSLFGSANGIVLITVAPFALVALIMVIAVLRGGAKVRASRNWDTTTGRVLYSGVASRRSSTSEGGTNTYYYPQVAYEYEVRGQRYQSQRIAFGNIGYGSPRKAEELASRYVMGGPVQVFYDPANPDQAVLERRSGSNRALVLGVTLIVVILIASLAFTTGLMGSAGDMVKNLFSFGANPPAATVAPAPTSAPAVTKIAAPTATVPPK